MEALEQHLMVQQFARANGLCGADFEDDQHDTGPYAAMGIYFTCSEDAGHEGIHRDAMGDYEERGPQPEEV